jgi:hypothetical protein
MGSLQTFTSNAALHGHFTILDSLGHFALIEDPQACAKALAQKAAHWP